MGPCVLCHDLQGVSEQDVNTSKAFAWGSYMSLLSSAKYCVYCSILTQAISLFLSSGDEPRYWQFQRPLSSSDIITIHYTPDPSRHAAWVCLQVSLDSKSNDIQTSTKNPEYLEQMRKWTHDCVGTHNACAKQAQGYLPTRVLDVEGNSDVVVLHDTRPDDGGQYVALSHCWGDYRPIQTMTSNITQFRNGISVERLPATFRDAVYVTRQLRCQYLWIDSLCIIQDDKQDWAHEAARMAEVYGNSLVTLAASSSEDCRGGLFHDYMLSDAQKTLEVRDNINSHVMKVKVCPVNHECFESGSPRDMSPLCQLPLMRRAWCFQEHLLSPRLLHFSHHELIWECSESKACTCTAGVWKIFPTMKDRISTRSETDPKLWWDLVEAFSHRHISLHSDVLPALAGLARTLSSKGLGEYVSGLWRRTLVFDLGWQVACSKMSHSDKLRPRRSEDDNAPSWSWISVIAPVSISEPSRRDYSSDADRQPVSEIVDVAGPDLSQDLFASISITALDIRGKISCAVVSEVDGGHYARIKISGLTFDADWIPDVVSEILQAYTLPFEVQILWTFAHVGIVLKAVTGKADTYRRLGVILSSRNAEYKYASKLESKVIRLV